MNNLQQPSSETRDKILNLSLLPVHNSGKQRQDKVARVDIYNERPQYQSSRKRAMAQTNNSRSPPHRPQTASNRHSSQQRAARMITTANSNHYTKQRLSPVKESNHGTNQIELHDGAK